MSDDEIYTNFVASVAENFFLTTPNHTATILEVKAHFMQMHANNELDPMKCHIRTESDVWTAVYDAFHHLQSTGRLEKVNGNVFRLHSLIPPGLFDSQARICSVSGCKNTCKDMCKSCKVNICGQVCFKRHVRCSH